MLRTACALLIASTALLGDELPEKTRLSSGRPRFLVRRNYQLAEGREEVEKPASRKGRIDKFEVFFYDVDGNGKFNDAGVDGWSLPKMPFMLPLEDDVVIGRSVIHWKVEADGSLVRWRKEPIPVGKDQEKTLVEFNTWRFMNGLPGVTVLPKLSDACAKHCVYMEKNGMVHMEEEGKSGYTPAGAEAGLRSCLSPEGPRRSVRLFYATFYHRLPLIRPDTRAIGIGISRRYTAIDGLTNRKPRAWRYPILIPAPNSWFQPTHFARERPLPYPEDMKPGFPITLTFDRGTITDAQATLRFGGKKGPVVRTLVSSPEYPANKKRPKNRMTICVLPRLPLRPMKRYWVHVSYKLDGKDREHTWIFSTGRAGPLPLRRR